MILGADRGVKTNLWFANELLRGDDVMFLSQATYQNLTDMAALLGSHVDEDGTGPDRVISGLQIIPTGSGMNSNLKAGLAVSYSGRYFTGDTWGFVSSLGESFAVWLDDGDDAGVTFSGGHATLQRNDIVEIRPIVTDYDPQSREFKDPIGGSVSVIANTNTKREYGFEVNLKEGTPGSNAPATTQGWIKVAEAQIPALTTLLTQAMVKNADESDEWTTDTNGTQPPEIKASDLTVSENIYVDTITERTANAGVTIENILLEDGAISASGSLTVESVLFNGQAISNVTSIDATSISNSGGNLGLEGLAVNGSNISNLSGTTTIESVVFNGDVISNVDSIDANSIANSGGGLGVESLSISGSQIANASGTVQVESVIFDGLTMSNITAITVTGSIDTISASVSGTLTVDTINEDTGSAGVTVEGVKFEDSVIEVPGSSISFTGADANRTISLSTNTEITFYEPNDEIGMDIGLGTTIGIRGFGSTVLGLNYLYGAYTNQDAEIHFAQDASFAWDESEDYFVLDKDIRFQPSATDNTDMWFVRNDTTTQNPERLGRIMFDTTDNISTNEASAVIQVAASTVHSPTSKGADFSIRLKSDTTGASSAPTPRLYLTSNGTMVVNSSSAIHTSLSTLESHGDWALIGRHDTSGNTTKRTRIGLSHYTNSEEPVTFIYGFSDGSDNVVNIGGGTSEGNAATDIRFYAASGDTTTIGNFIMAIDYQSVVVKSDYYFAMEERATAPTQISGLGIVWVKNTTPTELWFTADDGTDTKIV